MSAPQDPIADTSPDGSRSGADMGEAIEVAEAGSRVEDVHDGGPAGEAPVERVRDDPEMTEGQVVLGPGDEAGAGSGEADGVSSGAAQSVRGARPVDRAD